MEKDLKFIRLEVFMKEIFQMDRWVDMVEELVQMEIVLKDSLTEMRCMVMEFILNKMLIKDLKECGEEENE